MAEGSGHKAESAREKRGKMKLELKFKLNVGGVHEAMVTFMGIVSGIWFTECFQSLDMQAEEQSEDKLTMYLRKGGGWDMSWRE